MFRKALVFVFFLLLVPFCFAVSDDSVPRTYLNEINPSVWPDLSADITGVSLYVSDESPKDAVRFVIPGKPVGVSIVPEKIDFFSYSVKEADSSEAIFIDLIADVSGKKNLDKKYELKLVFDYGPFVFPTEDMQKKWGNKSSKTINVVVHTDRCLKEVELDPKNSGLMSEEKERAVLLCKLNVIVLKGKYPEEKMAELKKAVDKIDTAISGDSYVKAHDSYFAFIALGNDRIAELFVKDPDKMISYFSEIAKTVEYSSAPVFSALGNDRIAELFVKDPDKMISYFSEIINAVVGNSQSMHSQSVFNALDRNNEIQELFLLYYNEKIDFGSFFIPLISFDDSFAIELGRPLDDLHDKPVERKKFLDSLSDLQVFGLLTSNPEFFYTSSNHLLFDRLKKDLGAGKVSVLFQKYNLVGTAQCRNFLFRAINYDRLYGQKNSLLDEADLKVLLPTLYEPLNSDSFDKGYFFLLANALDKIKGTEYVGDMKTILEERLRKGVNDGQLKTALQFALYFVDNNTELVSNQVKAKILDLREKSVYNPDYYKTDGKLIVIQVFDKEDTVGDHWGLTQKWFGAGKTPTDKTGKLVYEIGNAKVILFMGETEEENKEFIRKQLQETPNAIITFRGHSFSLLDSFPYSIFGNQGNHILFIPGSCGSAGSTAEYIAVNQNTDLRFFSNTSTGRGQVTNAIIQSLIDTKIAKSFQSILKENESKILVHGGDITTIKVWSPGEALLNYVYSQKKELPAPEPVHTNLEITPNASNIPQPEQTPNQSNNTSSESESIIDRIFNYFNSFFG
ncbi:MAG: hypothetical protein ABIA76_00325 [Candidatus Diapherotrites archaeon]